MVQRFPPRERAVATTPHFKTGLGGSVEAEFLVQALQTATRCARNFGAASDRKVANIISPRMRFARRGYEFLRPSKLSCAAGDTASSCRPTGGVEQRKLLFVWDSRSRRLAAEL